MEKVEVDKYYLERLEYLYKQRGYKIDELNKTIESLQQAKDHSDFIIRTELEPRIKQEKRSYDVYVSQATGERECEHFVNTIDNLEDFIKEHKPCFEWDELSNDLYAVILYLLKNREDVESGYYYIAEHKD